MNACAVHDHKVVVKGCELDNNFVCLTAIINILPGEYFFVDIYLEEKI